jgi:Pyridoxamine 5'-phosphate oxidase
LSDLDPIYKQLMDRPVTMTLGLIGPDGRPSLTPMWFDYEDDKVLVNTASHRPKCAWIRKNPRLTVLLVNPENPYHWMQIRCTVEKEMREWEDGGDYVTARPDLDEVHRQSTALRPARPGDRRETGAVHLPHRPHRDLRQAVGTTAWPDRSGRALHPHSAFCCARLASTMAGTDGLDSLT